MRVGVVAYTYYETDCRVMGYAEALAERGDHVDVLALRKEGQIRHEVLRGVNVYRIQRVPSTKSRRYRTYSKS